MVRGPRILRILFGRYELRPDEPFQKGNHMTHQPPTGFKAFLIKIKGPAIRAARTFAQTSIGVYLAGMVASPAVSDLANLTLLDSATAAGVVSVLTLVQNLLEESRLVNYDRG